MKLNQIIYQVEAKGTIEAWATTVYGERLDGRAAICDVASADDIVLIDSFDTFRMYCKEGPKVAG